MKRIVIFQLLLDRSHMSVRTSAIIEALPKPVMVDIFHTLGHSHPAPSILPTGPDAFPPTHVPPTDNLIHAQVWISCQSKH